MRRVELWDINNPESFKAGEACETENGVVIDCAYKYGLLECFSLPIQRLNRDLTITEVRPGDPGYFDEAVLDLSRAFAIRPVKGHEDDPLFERTTA